MSQSNNMTIEGNLCATPELRYTNSGLPVTNIRVAQTDSFMRNGQRVETTEYIQVVVWNQQAENVAYSLDTGDRVTVIGKLRQRVALINDEKRYFTELVADTVNVCLRWAVVEDITRSTKSQSVTDDAKEPVTPAGDPVYGQDEDEAPF